MEIAVDTGLPAIGNMYIVTSQETEYKRMTFKIPLNIWQADGLSKI
jgi:hypothetical protein